MILKKCNAVCSWILIIALIIHISLTMRFFVTGWYDVALFIVTSRAITVICILHVALSLGIVFFLHDGSDLRTYGRSNRRTIIQRASGLAILLLVHPHTQIFSSFIYDWLPLTTASKIIYFIIEAAFFAAVLLHLGVSFSRSFITMGMIRTDAAERRLDIAAGVLCAAGFLFTVIAMARFFVNWPAA